MRGTAISYFGGVDGETDKCTNAYAPGLSETTLTVLRATDGYVVTDNGCQVRLKLQGGILTGDDVKCDLDPESALVKVGVLERKYDKFRLNVVTGDFEYRFAQRQQTATASDGVLGCYVFAGEARPVN